MQNTLDQFVDGWQAMDKVEIGEALSSPAAFAPMEIGGLFDAIIGAGAVAAEVAVLMPILNWCGTCAQPWLIGTSRRSTGWCRWRR